MRLRIRRPWIENRRFSETPHRQSNGCPRVQALPTWKTAWECDSQQPLFVVVSGSCYAAVMTEHSPEHLRWFQVRLRTLLLLVVLISIACSIFLAPFRPNVSLSYLGRRTHIDLAGEETSRFRVAITNNGFLSIWYPAEAGRSAGFAYQSSPPKPNLGMLDDVPYDMGYDEWLELRPGETAEFQVDDSTASMKEVFTEQNAGNEALLKFLEGPLWLGVTIPVRDWRGRQTTCWNEPFRIE